MKKIQVSKRAVAIGCTFALALAVVVISGVSARTQENSPESLVNHALKGTYYDGSSHGANASCGTQNCVATANIYTESIPCPGLAGVKCTYEVNIAAETYILNPGNEGLYQFLIDGAIPTGGGTDGGGFMLWGNPYQTGLVSAAAYSVNSQVTNTSANQSHSIVVNVGCAMGNTGCNANTSHASLTVRVLKP